MLKYNIRKEINDIPWETFPKVIRNVTVRMLSVIGHHRRYVEHVVCRRCVLIAVKSEDLRKINTAEKFSTLYQFAIMTFLFHSINYFTKILCSFLQTLF